MTEKIEKVLAHLRATAKPGQQVSYISEPGFEGVEMTILGGLHVLRASAASINETDINTLITQRTY